MNIALTHAFCWPEVRRGAERFIQELGAALVERGHDVTILSSGWEPGRSVLDGVTTLRLRRRRHDQTAHEADFGRRVVPPLVRGGYDAVHSMGRHDALGSIRAQRIRRRRRTVFTDLGIPSREWWESVGRRENRTVEKVVRGIDVYSCMSEWALSYLPTNYGRTDGVVVPGGVDLRTMVPAAEREPAPTLLFSAALDEQRKGLSTLLEALPAVAAEEPDVRLWLSGPGDPSAFLAAGPAQAVERTDVLGPGEGGRQHERYGRAWATCLPSTYDSFGMALIESLACGTPIVVTTHGAPPELVAEGRNGELCEPGDAAGLAAALLRALRLTRDPATAERCRESVRRFDWREGLAPMVERLYA